LCTHHALLVEADDDDATITHIVYPPVKHIHKIYYYIHRILYIVYIYEFFCGQFMKHQYSVLLNLILFSFILFFYFHQANIMNEKINLQACSFTNCPLVMIETNNKIFCKKRDHLMNRF
jgi:hypothetical protein